MKNQSFDVVVVGGGTLGLVYSCWLKQLKPETSILILEAQSRPSYKIGESTLSSTIRCMKDIGFTYPILRRLFDVKEGLAYWWTGEKEANIHSPMDIMGLDETFQFERSVFESALMKIARSKGIQILQDARVRIRDCELDSKQKTVRFVHAGTDKEVKAKIICDGTGPSAVVSRSFGVKRQELDDFNTNSYYAYFKVKEKAPIANWNRPTTRHLCFKEGWMWFINLSSWKGSSHENIDEMIDHLLSLSGRPDQEFPSREALKKQFNTQSERIVSIGFVVRRDLLDTPNMSAEKAFEFFRQKYPAIDQMLENYELIPEQYSHTTWHKRMHIANKKDRVSGKGWLAVGEAAFLVDPFLSTGLNYGVGTSYMAAKASVSALDQDNYHTEHAFAKYERYCSDVFETLYNEVGMFYRAFKYKETFERILMFKLAYIVPDVLYKVNYTDEDPYVYDLLNPNYQAALEKIRRIMDQIEAKSHEEPSPDLLKALNRVIDDFQQWLLNHPRFGYIDFNRFFNHYNSQIERVEGCSRPRGDYEVTHCQACDFFATEGEGVDHCPNCGNPFEGTEEKKKVKNVSQTKRLRQQKKTRKKSKIIA